MYVDGDADWVRREIVISTREYGIKTIVVLLGIAGKPPIPVQ